MKLKYTIRGALAAGATVVINLPAGLTIRSRKMHRACLNYEIMGGYVKDTQANRTITFATAFDNWVTRASIKRGRNHWLESHREIFKNNPGLKPRWHDYKPALIQGQHIEMIGPGAPQFQINTEWNPENYINQKLPDDNRGQTWSVFTTESGMPTAGTVSGLGGAQLVDLDKDEFTSHIVGPHIVQGAGTTSQSFTSVGLIDSWFKSRPDIEPIDTIDDAEMNQIEADPLNLLFDDGDANNEKLENFRNAIEGNGLNEGDYFPMYSNQVINTLEEVAAVHTSSANPVSYFTGFTALTGQVAVVFGTGQASGDDTEIVFEVNPVGMTI